MGRHCYITRCEFEERVVKVHVFTVKNDRCRDSPCELFLEAIVGHVTSLLVGRTRDWLTGDDISGRVLCMILNWQLNSILTVHKTPLLTTRPGQQGRDWNHSRCEF